MSQKNKEIKEENKAKTVQFPGELNGRKYVFQLEEGAPWNDIKAMLSAYRDQIVMFQYEEVKKSQESLKKEDSSPKEDTK